MIRGSKPLLSQRCSSRFDLMDERVFTAHDVEDGAQALLNQDRIDVGMEWAHVSEAEGREDYERKARLVLNAVGIVAPSKP